MRDNLKVLGARGVPFCLYPQKELAMTIQLSDHFTYSRLVRFTLPSIAMMIFTSIYGVVDGIFVSNFAGKTATCTETGLTEGKQCAVCGEIIVAQEEIPVLGHDYVKGECSRCDAVLTSKFEDVKAGAFYFDPVEWAVGKGLTTGVDETNFGPLTACNRAQVVTFLWRAAGSPEPTITENPFVDVPAGTFYYKAVLWAVEEDITTGIDDSHFNPFGDCTRGQVVTFLWRAMGKPDAAGESTFSDVTVPGAFYYKAVLWAVENGITAGMGDGTFGINAVCNRAQIVTFLYRVYAV